jgi:hypothetical protein
MHSSETQKVANPISLQMECALIALRSASVIDRSIQRQRLVTLVYPLLIKSAAAHWRHANGGNYGDANDLAQAAYVKIFGCTEDLSASEEGCGVSSRSEALNGYEIGSGIQAYISRIVKNLLNEDYRAVAGRDKELPRVFLNDFEEELKGLQAHRRSQSGYMALNQSKSALKNYLNQLTGKCVMIEYTLAGEKKMKRVPLTENHKRLLEVWMQNVEERSASWAELAEEMGSEVGALKRWFSEVKAHLKADDSVEARRLRALYSV